MGGDDLRMIMANPTTRGRFLAGTATAVAMLAFEQRELARAAMRGRRPRLASNPFTLGVASGDPAPHGALIWTRLAPDPLTAAPASPWAIPVDWEVYSSDALSKVVRKGTTRALPENAHAVHVELQGLKPARPYWYRFRADGFVSPPGRTVTAPERSALPSELRMAFCSCSDWQNGYFAAYRQMAEEQYDLILHLGDYIYEYGPAQSTFAGRVHTTPEAGVAATQLTTLADYRARHAQYKTDPATQAVHASAPWAPIWDDHEIENNYADDIDEESATSPAAFLLQRAAGYKAYFEHTPLRRSAAPSGPDMQLYRRLRYGRLLDLHLLDSRQYRTDQPDDLSTPIGQALAASDFRPSLPPDGNPAGTLLGAAQEKWLLEGFAKSRARWTGLGNQVMMARFNFGKFIPPAGGGPVIYNVDQWDGYGAQRQRILDAVADRDLSLVVLTGDIHSAWVHDLKASFDDPSSATVGTELITSSVTADFPTSLWAPVEGAAATTPWTHYFDARRRGYVACTITPDTWTADIRAVASSPATGQVTAVDAPVTTAATFVVEHGQAGATRTA
jgi:alkaline phosphatase D